MTGGRKAWLNLEICTKFPIFSVVELFAVVKDDGLRDAKSADNRLPDKLGGVPLGDCGEGFCLDPLGEVINGNNCELGLASTSGKWTNQVDPPFGERVRAAEGDQLSGGSMGDVGEALTLVAFEHKISSILVEGRPEVACTEYFVCERPATRMIATDSFMDLLHYIGCLGGAEAS